MSVIAPLFPIFLMSLFNFSFHATSDLANSGQSMEDTGFKKDLFISGIKSNTSPEKNKTMAFYLQDGVEVLDFAGPMEVFSYAGYKVFTVSKTKDAIISQGILKIVPDYDLSDAPEADVLAFFGGNSEVASSDTDVINWVKNRKNVDYYFSVCTGAFILAESGILDGHKATTFHSSLDNLEQRYPKIEVLREVRFVDNGKVITTAGISAGIDGALHMVAKLQGLGQAKRVAYYMEYDNWIPGDGLILSDDDLYLKTGPANDLNEYFGTYEHLSGTDISIGKGRREGELTVVVNGKKTPLFYAQADKFNNVDGVSVLFQRNDNGKIIGYQLEEKDTVYKKKF